MTTGKLIKHFREKADLSIPAAAAKARVAQRAWYQLEADENSPTVSTLQKIATALNVNPRNLIPVDAETSLQIA